MSYLTYFQPLSGQSLGLPDNLSLSLVSQVDDKPFICMVRKYVFYCALLSLIPLTGFSQLSTMEQIREATSKQMPVALGELRDFLRLANDGKVPEEVQRNLEWCRQSLTRRKFEVRELRSGNVPYLFGQRLMNKKLPWILVYMQIDGQPARGLEWDQKDPFEAELKTTQDGKWTAIDWKSPIDPAARIFARSASDSKGPAQAFLSALDILDQRRVAPTVNIKVILDFQEEMGSPTLPALVSAHAELLSAKLVLIMDGARHVSNLPTLNFGARGIASIRLTVFGPTVELHSGQYGNFAPNPVFQLGRLLGEMKDEQGRVLIPGFYDGVTISEDERRALNGTPNDDAALIRRIGVAHAEGVAPTYEESLQYPSLNVRGLQAAATGEDVRGVIPAEAVAEIDLRLVPETDGERMVKLVRDFVLSKGFHLVDSLPTANDREKFDKLASFTYRLGSKPFRTDLNSPAGQWLDKAMTRTFGQGKYVRQRTTGGSQPIEPFITTLGIPAISVRFPNADNNIHAANENLTIGCFDEGLRMCVGILTERMK